MSTAEDYKRVKDAEAKARRAFFEAQTDRSVRLLRIAAQMVVDSPEPEAFRVLQDALHSVARPMTSTQDLDNVLGQIAVALVGEPGD